MKVKNYQELIVWQKAMDLVEEVYKFDELSVEVIARCCSTAHCTPPTAHRPGLTPAKFPAPARLHLPFPLD